MYAPLNHLSLTRDLSKARGRERERERERDLTGERGRNPENKHGDKLALNIARLENNCTQTAQSPRVGCIRRVHRIVYPAVRKVNTMVNILLLKIFIANYCHLLCATLVTHHFLSQHIFSQKTLESNILYDNLLFDILSV